MAHFRVYDKPYTGPDPLQRELNDITDNGMEIFCVNVLTTAFNGEPHVVIIAHSA